MKVNQRAKRSVKRRPWQLLEAPTADQPDSGAQDPLGPKVPDDTTVNFVLDLSMRIGEVQMSSGAGAADVTATIIALTSALGLPHCEVDVIFTSITVTCHRGTDLAAVTAMRVVRSRSLDYSRLSAAEILVGQITRGNIPLRRFGTALDIAEAVCFLASERAAFITGQALDVDGGYGA